MSWTGIISWIGAGLWVIAAVLMWIGVLRQRRMIHLMEIEARLVMDQLETAKQWESQHRCAGKHAGS